MIPKRHSDTSYYDSGVYNIMLMRNMYDTFYLCHMFLCKGK